VTACPLVSLVVLRGGPLDGALLDWLRPPSLICAAHQAMPAADAATQERIDSLDLGACVPYRRARGRRLVFDRVPYDHAPDAPTPIHALCGPMAALWKHRAAWGIVAAQDDAGSRRPGRRARGPAG